MQAGQTASLRKPSLRKDMTASNPAPYNPLDISNLAISVGLALEAQAPVQLTQLSRFVGAGLYALYYRGSEPLYRRIADANTNECRIPIYVGKAIVDKARKGGGDFSSGSTSQVLYRRILKHKRSIQAASNLDASDFWVRHLVSLPVWIPLGEASLVARYRPLWNVAMDGFGNNNPGRRRREQYRSLWDIVHPGRSWAALQGENPIAITDVEQRVRAHLAVTLGPESSESGE